VVPDTSRDKEIVHTIFGELNRELLRIRDDEGLVIISDSNKEEVGADVVLANVPPQSPRDSQYVTTSITEDEEEREVGIEDGISEGDVKS
jgi:hypothetical protein